MTSPVPAASPAPRGGVPDARGAATGTTLPPAARRTAERIEVLLREGALGSDGKLPSERDLVRTLQVSRSTLRRALASLSDGGVISSSPQSGWFVTGAPLGEPPRTLISFTEMARRRGAAPRTEVLSHVVREATLDEAAALGTGPLSPVLDIERLRRLGATPICLDHSVISLERTPGLDSVELEDCSLYERMEALGTEPARSTFAVEAVGASAREAGLLEVAPGSPLLLGVETCFDAVGLPLLTGSTRYRANAYRFYSTMVRR